MILNKADIAGEHLDDVLAFTRATLRDCGVLTNIYPLSATAARQHQRADEEYPAFLRFVDAFHDFVTTSGRPAGRTSRLRRARRLIERVRLVVNLRKHAAELPYIERERRLAALGVALAHVSDRRRTLELLIDADVRLLRAQMGLEIDRLTKRDAPMFTTYAEKLSTALSDGRRNAMIEAWISAYTTLWREEIASLVESTLQSCREKYARETSELERAMFAAGCSILHLEAQPLEPEHMQLDPAQLSVTVSGIPISGLALWLALARRLPKSLRRRFLLHLNLSLLQTELSALRGKVRYGIATDLERWRRNVRRAIAQHLDGMLKTVRHALADEAKTTLPELGIDSIERQLDNLAKSFAHERRAS